MQRLAITIIVAALFPMGASAQTIPTVSEPITGGVHGWAEASSFIKLGEYGYTEEEFFISGKASRYVPMTGAALGEDGKWSVRALAPETYKTRILVRRPIDPKKFNGSVVVEWLQSQGAFDKDVYWIWTHEEILREGFAWVGVTADATSITGTAPAGAITTPPGAGADNSRGLAHWDPQRYGVLQLASEDLGYDVFSQAGRVVGPKRSRSGRDPMGGLNVERLLAVGATGSSVRLLTYYNAVQPVDHVYDGFLLHARIYPQSFPLAIGVPQADVVHVRADATTPLIVTNNQGEAQRHYRARQPDGRFYRLWEVVGALHTNDYWTPKFGSETARDFGGSPSQPCSQVGDVPSQYVENAALVALDRWARGRGSAPSFPPITFSGSPPLPETDSVGNAKGGVRLPEILEPVARYDGKMNQGCEVTTIPSSRQDLLARYPTFDSYVTRYRRAVEQAQAQGILLPADAAKELQSMERRRGLFSN